MDKTILFLCNHKCLQVSIVGFTKTLTIFNLLKQIGCLLAIRSATLQLAHI